MLQRLTSKCLLAICAVILTLTGDTVCWQGLRAEPASTSFPNGLPKDPNFFPIAVWLQQPRYASKFKAIGINTFVGLWNPLTPTMLAQLRVHGMRLILSQSQEALALKDRPVLGPIIAGWTHIDEPDNAQPNGSGDWGDCVSPEEIVRIYNEIRARDATRPVYLGFGQGVANPKWIGRGSKCASIPLEDYYKPASAGADIITFAVYPVADSNDPNVMGKLELVGRGVRNLRRWAPSDVAVWADIETTHIKNPKRRPTPEEIRSEVWMAIINGATGITYFVHEWEPSFKDDGVFRYLDVTAELKRLNGQIKDLAPVLNGPTIANAAKVETSGEIAYMVKQDADAMYVFAVNMEPKALSAKVTMTAAPTAEQAVVLGEDRTLSLIDGLLDDKFEPYQAHIYQLRRK